MNILFCDAQREYEWFEIIKNIQSVCEEGGGYTLMGTYIHEQSTPHDY
jgi:hypothetical protein